MPARASPARDACPLCGRRAIPGPAATHRLVCTSCEDVCRAEAPGVARWIRRNVPPGPQAHHRLDPSDGRAAA